VFGLAEIDPVFFFDTSYYVVPDRQGERRMRFFRRLQEDAIRRASHSRDARREHVDDCASG